MTIQRKQKTFEIKGGGLDGNALKGGAAGIGNLDCYGDVIFPGFFSTCLPGFLSDGFVAGNHDWTQVLAMPTLAEERGNQLYTEAEFHSTQDAQDARTKCQERMAKGLSVGLSIGFDMLGDGWKSFKSGPDLLAYAKAQGYDLSLFDVEGIQAHTGRCQGLLKCNTLYEYSLATVPANRAATATEVKTDLKMLKEMQRKIAEGKTAEGKTILVTKGEYLGEDIEAAATISALSRLVDRLFYRVIYSAICGSYAYDYDLDDYVTTRLPLADALVTVGGAIDEFKDIALRVIEAIMSGAESETEDGGDAETDTAEKALAALRALYGDADTKSFSEGVHAASTFETQIKAALAAAKSCTERGQAIQALRASTKEGRVLSEANRQKLADHKDALAECITTIEGLLEASQPKAAKAALLRARAAFLVHQNKNRRQSEILAGDKETE